MRTLALVAIFLVLVSGSVQAGYYSDKFDEAEEKSREKWGWCCEEEEKQLRPGEVYRSPREPYLERERDFEFERRIERLEREQRALERKEREREWAEQAQRTREILGLEDRSRHYWSPRTEPPSY